MKKISFLLLIVFLPLVELFALANPNIFQTKYRWRNDNGSETAATWKAAENTQITINDFSTLRMRIEMRNSGAASGNVSQNLEYSIDNGTNWISMDNPATNPFTYESSTNVANGAATTDQMSAGTGGTFVAGLVIAAPGTAAALASGRKTQYEWIIKPTLNIEPSSTYIFRFFDQQGTATVYPMAVTTCFVPPNAGTIHASSDTISCHSVDTLKLKNNTSGAQIGYKWQKRVGNTWLDIGTNSSTVVTDYLLVTTDYRCIVTCGTTQSDTTPVFKVHVLPLPVSLGSDLDTCYNSNPQYTLDAGVFPNSPQYFWENGSVNQVRTVTQSGKYAVMVTDQFTCKGYDTINLGLYINPVVNLGNDTNICIQGSLVLDAANTGNAFLWNTGGNTQQITVQSPGEYRVIVETPDGCKATDSIKLTMMGQFPAIDDIIAINNGVSTFTFTADNPRHVISYDWDFGDGTPNGDQPSVTHVYSAPGDYEVTLKLQSTCGSKTYTRYSSIVGINQLQISDEELLLFPNPARSNVSIINRGIIKLERIEMYGIDGRMIYNEKANSATRHDLNTGFLPKGIYLLKIFSDKGVIVRKLQII